MPRRLRLHPFDVMLLLIAIAAQQALILWLYHQLAKARRSIQRTHDLVMSGEAVRIERRSVDAPVVMRLHLKQDR